MADAPVTPVLHGAVEDFLAAYRAKYRNTGKGGMRSNAPMLAEVTALNAAFRAPPSPPVAAPAEPDHEKLIAVLRSARQLVQARAHDIEANTTLRWVWEKQAADLDEALGSVIAAPQPPRPGTAPLSDEQIAIRAACSQIIKSLADIVTAPIADERPFGETVRREPLMRRVEEIKAQVDAIYKAVPHPMMQAGHPTTPTPKD